MRLLIFEYKKKNSKISENEEIVKFLKHAYSGDEANLYLWCCLRHAYF